MIGRFLAPDRDRSAIDSRNGDEGTRRLFEYIEVFYHQRRRHSTIGYVSPTAFEQRALSAATGARCVAF